ncbi:hypothetical protein CHCC20331_0441 [Bacillus paralicheniformis]|nr:hypothetical protein CHCC20331_0441 [Bacillus paralicheniformis]
MSYINLNFILNFLEEFSPGEAKVKNGKSLSKGEGVNESIYTD